MQKELTNKQQAFIQEYCSNGYNASQAYKTAYPNCNGGWDKLGSRLMVNDGIKLAIMAFKAKIQAKTDYNRSQAELEYEQVRTLAITKKDLAAANQAIKGKAKLYGLEVDVHQDITDQQRALTEAEKVEAQRLAGIRLRQA